MLLKTLLLFRLDVTKRPCAGSVEEEEVFMSKANAESGISQYLYVFSQGVTSEQKDLGLAL